MKRYKTPSIFKLKNRCVYKNALFLYFHKHSTMKAKPQSQLIIFSFFFVLLLFSKIWVSTVIFQEKNNGALKLTKRDCRVPFQNLSDSRRVPLKSIWYRPRLDTFLEKNSKIFHLERVWEEIKRGKNYELIDRNERGKISKGKFHNQ